MNSSPSHHSAARSGPAVRLLAVLALAQLPLAPLAPALTPPQDSTHPVKTFPMAADEVAQHGALIANGKVFYAAIFDGTTLGLRARNFSGELVFEHLDPRAQLVKTAHVASEQRRINAPQYGIASDGRIYYRQMVSGSNNQARVLILDSNGTKVGDFGPEGGASQFDHSPYWDTQPILAVSPGSGRVYVSDDIGVNGAINPAKKGLIRVFDRDGTPLHTFSISGVLAPTLEGHIGSLAVRVDKDGNDEVIVIDQVNKWAPAHLKFFRGDGSFIKVFPGNTEIFGQRVCLSNNLMVFGPVDAQSVFKVYSPSASNWLDSLASIPRPIYRSSPIGFTASGNLLVEIEGSVSSDRYRIHEASYPNYATFFPGSRNSVPNPWVLNVAQRPGSGIVDIDYRVDDVNDATVTTALLGFADGTASLNNVIPLTTVLEGTAARIGANTPTGAVQRVTWNAGADWNVDFGTLRVMALARDSRQKWFDVHLVEIPADGVRPAVTIHRTTMTHPDFLAQFLWLVATRDPSVSLVDGTLFGTSGAYDGVILASGTTSTAAGRAFLLARDGLRIATATEVTRAREGATPNFVVSLAPPLQIIRGNVNSADHSFSPKTINEFGIEASYQTTELGDAAGRWYVVRELAP
jgi:hypothetical protein